MFITNTFLPKIIALPFLFVLLNYSKASTNVPETNNDYYLKNIVINELIGMLRNVIKNGSPEADVPVLDPYVFDNMEYHLPGNYLSLKANITNGTFSGFGSFQVQSYEFETSDMALELDIRIPVLTFDAEYYELQGDIIEAVPLQGRGRLHFEAVNLKFLCKVYLEQSENKKSIIIEKFEKPNYAVERIVSRTQYDNNIDEIFNAMVEDLLAEYLNRFSKFISSIYIDGLQQTLNPFLSKFETWDILAILFKSK